MDWTFLLELLDTYGYLVGGILLLILLSLVVWWDQKRRLEGLKATENAKPEFRWSYILGWPLLLDYLRYRDPQRQHIIFTKRELIGWGVVILVTILAVIFDLSSRRGK